MDGLAGTDSPSCVTVEHFDFKVRATLRSHWPLHDAGHFISSGNKGPQFRGHANQEAKHAEFQQIPLRQVYFQKQRLPDVDMHESPTDERDPTDVIRNFSNQL